MSVPERGKRQLLYSAMVQFECCVMRRDRFVSCKCAAVIVFLPCV